MKYFFIKNSEVVISEFKNTPASYLDDIFEGVIIFRGNSINFRCEVDDDYVCLYKFHDDSLEYMNIISTRSINSFIDIPEFQCVSFKDAHAELKIEQIKQHIILEFQNFYMN